VSFLFAVIFSFYRFPVESKENLQYPLQHTRREFNNNNLLRSFLNLLSW